jgi:hypothetical protein
MAGAAGHQRRGVPNLIFGPCLGLWVKLGVVRVADDEEGREILEWVLGDGSLIRAGARSAVGSHPNAPPIF